MTNYDPQLHHRHSIRLKGYDYTLPGPYFITLVTQQRANLFGEITDGVMCLDQFGEIIQSAWLRLPVYFPIEQDSWVIMPNHLHAILWITDLDRVEASQHPSDWQPWDTLQDASPLHRPAGTSRGSLGAIIQNFKTVTTRKINQGRGEASAGIYRAAPLLRQADASPRRPNPIWQRNYYDHIIRNQKELDQIRHYILENPRMWCEDQENMESSPK